MPKVIVPFIGVPKAGIAAVLLGSEDSKKTETLLPCEGAWGTAGDSEGTAGDSGRLQHSLHGREGGSLLPLPGSCCVSSLGRTAWCTC